MSEQTKERLREEGQNPQTAQLQNQRGEKEVSPSAMLAAKDTIRLPREGSRLEKTSVLSYERSEKLFGECAPLARVLSSATSVLEEETRLIADRSSLSALRSIAQQKETLLTQHDLQLLRLKGKEDDFSIFVSKLDKGVRARLRALYGRFEKALRQNGLRLKAALQSSEMLLAALSEAAQAASPKGPQLYTPQGRLSETDSVSLSLSPVLQSEV